jgi:hypothetical protein
MDEFIGGIGKFFPTAGIVFVPLAFRHIDEQFSYSVADGAKSDSRPSFPEKYLRENMMFLEMPRVGVSAFFADHLIAVILRRFELHLGIAIGALVGALDAPTRNHAVPSLD